MSEGLYGGAPGLLRGGGSARAKTFTASVPLTTGLLTTVSSFGLLAPVTFAKTGGNANLTLASNGQISATAALTAGATQSLTGTATGADGVVFPFTANLTGAVSVPAAPTVTLTPGDGQISIAWVDGSNGGATITAHTIYVNGAAMLPISSASPYVLTGLANGTSVNIEVSATNSAGEGAKSTVQSATPAASSLTGQLFAIDAAWQNSDRPIAWNGYTFLQTVSGNRSGGTIELHRYNSATGKRDTFPLNYRFGVDDHFTGALLKLPSGKLFVNWQYHGDGSGFRYTVSDIDPTTGMPTFREQKTPGTGAGQCAYSDVHWMSTDGGATGHVFVFQRMNSTTTNDRGYWVTTIAELEAWAAGGATAPTWTFQLVCNVSGSRPYWMTAKKSDTELHFVGNYGNYAEITPCPVWHSVVKYDGTTTLKWYLSDGVTEITATKPFNVSNFTVVQDGANSTEKIGFYDIGFASDGNPLLLTYRFPTGPNSTNSDRAYAVQKYVPGTGWTRNEFLTGQAPPINEPTQVTQATGFMFDGNDTTKMYVVEKTQPYGTLGGSLTQWSINHTTLACTRTATLVPETVGVGIMRPKSAIGHSANDPVYYIRQNGWTMYQNYDADLMIYGVYNPETLPATPEAEATALFARMTTAPSDTLKTHLNALIRDLKAGPKSGSNIWAKRGVMYFLATEALDQALLDIADVPGTGANNAQVTGSPTFTAGKGIAGSGTNNLTSPAPNAIPGASQNSVAIAYACGNFSTGAGGIWGVTNGQLTAIPGNGAYTRMNSATGISVLSGQQNQGFVGGTRSVSGTSSTFGTTGKTSGAATSAAPTTDRRQFARGTENAQFVWMSQGLTDNEMADLRFLTTRLIRETRAIEG